MKRNEDKFNKPEKRNEGTRQPQQKQTPSSGKYEKKERFEEDLEEISGGQEEQQQPRRSPFGDVEREGEDRSQKWRH